VGRAGGPAISREAGVRVNVVPADTCRLYVLAQPHRLGAALVFGFTAALAG
jgi:hypothetical protein